MNKEITIKYYPYFNSKTEVITYNFQDSDSPVTVDFDDPWEVKFYRKGDIVSSKSLNNEIIFRSASVSFQIRYIHINPNTCILKLIELDNDESKTIEMAIIEKIDKGFKVEVYSITGLSWLLFDNFNEISSELSEVRVILKFSDTLELMFYIYFKDEEAKSHD